MEVERRRLRTDLTPSQDKRDERYVETEGEPTGEGKVSRRGKGRGDGRTTKGRFEWRCGSFDQSQRVEVERGECLRRVRV